MLRIFPTANKYLIYETWPKKIKRTTGIQLYYSFGFDFQVR